MYNFIILIGAQGSGKTTVARLLKEKLESVHIDYDWIRGFHLNKTWSNINDSEEQMSQENLIFILKNYAEHNYKNVIVSGFTWENIKLILEKLHDYKNIVITLTLSDNEVLKHRVLDDSRDSGFRDFEESIKFNQQLKERLDIPNEHKIDNTLSTPEETADQIIRILE